MSDEIKISPKNTLSLIVLLPVPAAAAGTPTPWISFRIAASRMRRVCPMSQAHVVVLIRGLVVVVTAMAQKKSAQTPPALSVAAITAAVCHILIRMTRLPQMRPPSNKPWSLMVRSRLPLTWKALLTRIRMSTIAQIPPLQTMPW